MLLFTVRLPFPLLCFWVVVLEIFVEQTHNGFIVNPGVWWAHRVAGAWRSRVRLQLGSIDSCALRSLLHRNNLFLFMLHVHVLLFYRTQIKTFFWLDPILKICRTKNSSKNNLSNQIVVWNKMPKPSFHSSCLDWSGPFLSVAATRGPFQLLWVVRDTRFEPAISASAVYSTTAILMSHPILQFLNTKG